MKNLTVEQRIENSETRIFKAVFPNTTNHYETLFGGTALQLMDEASFICATRFSRKRMVTVSTDRIDFEKSIPEGSIIELVAKVVKVGTTSCKIKVDIYTERMYANERELAVTGHFTFVAINEYKNPVTIL